MNKQNNFSEILLRLIKESKKSVNQVERDLGLPRNSLHNYKDGKEPSASRLIAIANYFRVSPEYLIGLGADQEVIDLSFYFNRLNSEQKKGLYLLCQEWLLKQVV